MCVEIDAVLEGSYGRDSATGHPKLDARQLVVRTLSLNLLVGVLFGSAEAALEIRVDKRIVRLLAEGGRVRPHHLVRVTLGRCIDVAAHSALLAERNLTRPLM